MKMFLDTSANWDKMSGMIGSIAQIMKLLLDKVSRLKLVAMFLPRLKFLNLEEQMMIEFSYQNPDPTMTLRQGLKEYYLAHPDFYRFDDGDQRIIAQVFRAHDVAHVITGLGTNYYGEVLLDTFQFWGTWVSLKKVVEIYTDKEFLSTLGSILSSAENPREYATLFLRCFIPSWRVLFNCLTMRKKWPYFDYDHYLDLPLNQIREEFGIRMMSLAA